MILMYTLHVFCLASTAPGLQERVPIKKLKLDEAYTRHHQRDSTLRMQNILNKMNVLSMRPKQAQQGQSKQPPRRRMSAPAITPLSPRSQKMLKQRINSPNSPNSPNTPNSPKSPNNIKNDSKSTQNTSNAANGTNGANGVIGHARGTGANVSISMSGSPASSHLNLSKSYAKSAVTTASSRNNQNNSPNASNSPNNQINSSYHSIRNNSQSENNNNNNYKESTPTAPSTNSIITSSNHAVVASMSPSNSEVSPNNPNNPNNSKNQTNHQKNHSKHDSTTYNASHGSHASHATQGSMLSIREEGLPPVAGRRVTVFEDEVVQDDADGLINFKEYWSLINNVHLRHRIFFIVSVTGAAVFILANAITHSFHVWLGLEMYCKARYWSTVFAAIQRWSLYALYLTRLHDSFNKSSIATPKWVLITIALCIGLTQIVSMCAVYYAVIASPSCDKLDKRVTNGMYDFFLFVFLFFLCFEAIWVWFWLGFALILSSF